MLCLSGRKYCCAALRFGIRDYVTRLLLLMLTSSMMSLYPCTPLQCCRCMQCRAARPPPPLFVRCRIVVARRGEEQRAVTLATRLEHRPCMHVHSSSTIFPPASVCMWRHCACGPCSWRASPPSGARIWVCPHPQPTPLHGATAAGPFCLPVCRHDWLAGLVRPPPPAVALQ